MLLYKYTTLEVSKKILKENKIRYTQPLAFNDPFEAYPIAENPITTERINELLTYAYKNTNYETLYRKALDALFIDLQAAKNEPLSKIELDKYLKAIINSKIKEQGENLLDIILSKIRIENKEFTIGIFKYLQDMISGQVGILSLTSAPTNILMWSHYSDAHNGIVMVMNTENNYFKNLSKVTYNNNRPSLDINQNTITAEQSFSLAQKIFYTKHLDWSYEQEYRDLKPLVSGKVSSSFDKNGYSIILFDFPKEIISGIIFGCKVMEPIKKMFINEIKQLGYNISFQQAILDDDKFQFNLFDIK